GRAAARGVRPGTRLPYGGGPGQSRRRLRRLRGRRDPRALQAARRCDHRALPSPRAGIRLRGRRAQRGARDRAGRAHQRRRSERARGPAADHGLLAPCPRRAPGTGRGLGRRAMSDLGRLVLLPVPLDPDQSPLEVLPPATLGHFARIDVFVVENAKAARRFLKPLVGDRPLQSLELVEWNANQRRLSAEEALEPLRHGRDIGLLSDAGCPAVADPGADLVAAAHRLGARVVPAIGPSALLLALMASGMGGQRFGFAGYLPSEADARRQALRALELRSAAGDETILFIE